MPSAVKIAPSILSADFARLGEEIAEVERAGADLIHVDVMDGRFVPNITIGPAVLAAVRRVTRLPLDVHLMIVEPERYLEAFAEAGADTIGLHIETALHAQHAFTEVRKLGKRSCAVLNPQTSEDALEYVLEDLDQVLVMSVNPGFGGQSFLPAVVPKIERLAQRIQARGLSVDIAVDGGISEQTAGVVARAGAAILIAGAAVFGKPDRGAAMKAIRDAAAVQS